MPLPKFIATFKFGFYRKIPIKKQLPVFFRKKNFVVNEEIMGIFILST